MRDRDRDRDPSPFDELALLDDCCRAHGEDMKSCITHEPIIDIDEDPCEGFSLSFEDLLGVDL